MAGRIVYVDDEPDLPSGFNSELGRLGFRLQVSSSCEEALGLARDGVARLLILEVLLENDRGWRLIEQIRSLAPPYGEIPIIILTRGERTPELYGRAVELGASDFLARPVMRAEILGAILECFEACDAAFPEDLRSFDCGGRTKDQPSGTLEEVAMPELLLQLRVGGATGVLFLQEFEGLAVQFRNGSPIGLAQSRGVETFSDFLMRTKRIAEQEHEQLLERVRSKGESESEAAVSIGALAPGEVREVLSDRSTEPLLEAFSWTTGSWVFEAGKRIRSGYELGSDVGRALARGVVQWTPARTIRAACDRRGALFLAKADQPGCRLGDLSPPPCEAAQLDRWSGDQTVAEVLERGEIGERELLTLLIAGLVETHAQPPLELTLIVEPEPLEIIEDEMAAPSTELHPPCDPVEAPDRATSTRDAASQLPDHTDELLDAPASSTENLPVDDPPDDPVSLEKPDADRSREAERHFLEGEKHLRATRHDDAVASFGMAAHLDPTQGEYLAHLGYAMHVQNPDVELVRKEALEHIARGIKLSGEQWKPLLFLSRVFMDAGEHANARKVLASAVRKYPDCEPLRTELKRLEEGQRTTREPTPRLMGRVRRWLGK